LQDIEYYLLNDGLAWVDGGGAFGLAPRIVWGKLLPLMTKTGFRSIYIVC
jgi:hypothetical protein